MEQAISSDLIRGHLDTIILHTLLDGDKFAQQICNAIEVKSGNEYQINQATLYSSLKRLESLKHVVSYWNDADDGRRKYFKITESGKNLIEQNLSNWSYSRAIIDKLMNLEPEKVVKIVCQTQTTNNEETRKTTENQGNNDVLGTVLRQNTAQNELEDKKSENCLNVSENINKDVLENKEKKVEEISEQELNFRSILSGLIKTSVIQKQTNNVQKENLEVIDDALNVQNNELKIDFNEKISNDELAIKKDFSAEKVDFSDLIEKTEKDGYKIKISSKESAYKAGRIYINKVNFVATILVWFLFYAEFLFIALKNSSLLNFSPIVFVMVGLFSAILPIMCGIKYSKNTRQAVMKINNDGILISFIILFNVVLISLAINLILDIDFNDINVTLYSLILPIVLSVNSLILYFFRFLIAKMQFSKVK